MHKVKHHFIETLQDSVRIESYCRGLFVELSSNKSVKKSVKSGVLRVGGLKVNSSYFVKKGDVIELWDLEESKPEPFDLAIEIVYEDDYLAVVLKPSGIVTSGNLFRTLENAVQGKLKPTDKNTLKWPKPIHRLDAPTSGLVIFAKTVEARVLLGKLRVLLGKLLEAKKIDKTYVALVPGLWDGENQIDTDVDGKKALTKLKLLKTEKSLNNGDISMLELKPVTGRTHQLRKHLSSKGFPIIGDKIYGIKGNTLLHKGLFLSAVSLQFEHPITKEKLTVKVDPPVKFMRLMKRELERFEKYYLPTNTDSNE